MNHFFATRSHQIAFCLCASLLTLSLTFLTSACSHTNLDCGADEISPPFSNIQNTPLEPVDGVGYAQTSSSGFRTLSEEFEVLSVTVVDDDKVHVRYMFEDEEYVDIYTVTGVDTDYI